MIAFIPLDESHVSLMHHWLNAGEALRWYGRQPSTPESIRQKYLVTKPEMGTKCFIVHHDHAPIGYLQYYRISHHPRYCALVGAGPRDYGMDLFIGRDDRIGLGIGTRIVAAALKELIFAQGDAERCLVGPSPENRRAIRCYEKCGFRHVKTVVTNAGEREHIMVIEKPNTTLTST
jgi:RimJ/RimL family protein N-acetyltransferase